MKNKSSLVIGTCIATLMLSAVKRRSRGVGRPRPLPPLPRRQARTNGKIGDQENESRRSLPWQNRFRRCYGEDIFDRGQGRDPGDKNHRPNQDHETRRGSDHERYCRREEVRGSYWKKEDGSLEARNVKIGPLSADESPARSAQTEDERSSGWDFSGGLPVCHGQALGLPND